MGSLGGYPLTLQPLIVTAVSQAMHEHCVWACRAPYFSSKIACGVPEGALLPPLCCAGGTVPSREVAQGRVKKPVWLQLGINQVKTKLMGL